MGTLIVYLTRKSYIKIDDRNLAIADCPASIVGMIGIKNPPTNRGTKFILTMNPVQKSGDLIFYHRVRWKQ